MPARSQSGGNLERLIDAIARDGRQPASQQGGPAASARTDPPPRAPSGRRSGIGGSAAVGFIVPVAIIGAATYAYLGLRSAPVVHRQDVPPPRIPLPPPDVLPAVVADDRPAPAVPEPRRPKPPRPAAARIRTRSPPPVEVAAPAPEPGKAVHLTGAALESALAEDRIKTRQLNLEELRARR